jgi:PAS domain-containing protein
LANPANRKRRKNKNSGIETILRAIPDFMLVLDGNGTFLDLHSNSDKKLLAPAEIIPGTNIVDHFPGGEAERQINLYRECLREQQLKVYHYRLEIEGKKLSFEARISPIDRERVLAAIIRKVTEQKVGKKKLKESKTSLRAEGNSG